MPRIHIVTDIIVFFSPHFNIHLGGEMKHQVNSGDLPPAARAARKLISSLSFSLRGFSTSSTSSVKLKVYETEPGCNTGSKKSKTSFRDGVLESTNGMAIVLITFPWSSTTSNVVLSIRIGSALSLRTTLRQ